MSNLRSMPPTPLTLPLNVVALSSYAAAAGHAHHAADVTPQQLFAEYSQAWLYGRTQPFHWAMRNPWLYLPYTGPPGGLAGRTAASCFHDTMRSVVGASQAQCDEPKPSHSYIGLIAMAILSAPERKMVLSEIYAWILSRYSYFRCRGPGWRNSIRHNLSLNDCFLKVGRSANGKGHYWAIHPANVADFERGDFRRRRAQRKVRRAMGLAVPEDEDDDDDDVMLSPTDPVNCRNTGDPGDTRVIPSSACADDDDGEQETAESAAAAYDNDNSSKNTNSNSNSSGFHVNDNYADEEAEEEELVGNGSERHHHQQHQQQQQQVHELKAQAAETRRTGPVEDVTVSTLKRNSSSITSSSSSSRVLSSSSVASVTDGLPTPMTPLPLTPKKRRFDMESLLLPDTTPSSSSHTPRALAIY